MPNEKMQPQEIVFPNDNGAKLVLASRGIPTASLIDSLGISPPKNLILLIGGADKMDEKLTVHLTQFFSRGIARGTPHHCNPILSQRKLNPLILLNNK